MKKIKGFLAGLVLILFAGTNVVFSIFLKKLLDSAMAKDYYIFKSFIVYTILILLLDLLLGILSRYLILKYTGERVYNIKNNQILKSLGENKSEDQISKFSTDTDLIYTNYYMNQLLFVYFFAQLIFSLGTMFYMNIKLSIVALIVSFLPLLVPMLLAGKLEKANANYTDSSKNYLALVSDILGGSKEINRYKAQGYFLDIHEKENQNLEDSRRKLKMTIFSSNRLSNFFGSLSFVAIIAFCGYLVIKGETTVGTLIAFIQLLNTVVGPIGNIGNSMGEYKSVKTLKESYDDSALTFRPVEKPRKNVDQIQVKDLSFAYNEGKEIFSDLNLNFQRGKSYLILGESGKGKSTIAKVLGGELDGAKGSLLYLDKDGKALDQSEVLENIQYVDQDPYIFNISAKDNIAFGDKIKDPEKFNLLKQSLELDQVFDETRGASIKNKLSGGEKERLAIFRALYNPISLLILDEPTASLNYRLADKAIDTIQKMDNDILIVISHDEREDFVSKFDQVIRI